MLFTVIVRNANEAAMVPMGGLAESAYGTRLESGQFSVGAFCRNANVKK
jgi:hypothetical protein